MHLVPKLFVLSFCLAQLLLLDRCGGSEVNPGQTKPTQQTILGVDQSFSISTEQLQQWLPPTTKLIDEIPPGTRLLIFGLHDHTMDADALLNETLPVMPEDPTLEEETAVRNEWQRIRTLAKKKVEEALQIKTRARATDILSICNRLPLAERIPTTLVLVTDALHCDQDFDLETMRVSDPRLPEQVNNAFTRRQLRPGMLQGVQVYFLLNSLPIGAPNPLNDRVALQAFWSNVFRQLGIQALNSFDTQLPYRPGGNYAVTIE